jgi:hypothetical protein
VIVTLWVNGQWIGFGLMVFNATFNDISAILLSTGHWGRRDLDRMVVGFTTTYAIDAYHH